MKECFADLDLDSGGSISIDELKDPLIGLGIAKNIEEIEEMVLEIDDDGEIEFHEFIRLIRNPKRDVRVKDSKVTQFFSDLCKGKYDGEFGDVEISFTVLV